MLIRVLLKIVQNPGLTLILYEEFARFRQIFTYGREHPPVASPAWRGYSIGAWDGDWFVVDTLGFNDRAGWTIAAVLNTEMLRTVERFRRRDSATWTSSSPSTIQEPTLNPVFPDAIRLLGRYRND